MPALSRPAGPGLVRDARGWLRDRRGATAVEFAIIGAPFFFMIFSILQLAMYFMVQVTLDNATANAARQLRTGQVIADGNSDTSGKQAFMTAVCNNMSWLQSQCQSGVTSPGGTQYLVVDVRQLGAYSNAAGNPTLNAGGNAPTNSCYYSGSAGSAVEMRAYYRWQMIVPELMSSLQTFANGVAELQSTEVFQIEPNGQTNPSATAC
ncbi:TadE/TadG family type IV pilus assembly protein [Caulobacter sp. S45]|uniref:TadE/TadG family type IV pilus assembly protein n=1 Tax=Caulobacter sp. S45 TaxID=1641861 RepID=UPI00157682CF|nr:TadE/TadG family type IV pilus assembly protein [Caulobacter sp. S45]